MTDIREYDDHVLILLRGPPLDVVDSGVFALPFLLISQGRWKALLFSPQDI